MRSRGERAARIFEKYLYSGIAHFEELCREVVCGVYSYAVCVVDLSLKLSPCYGPARTI